MYRDWNAVSVGYSQYYSIVMRTITFHTIHVHVGALENYTKSNNNYNKVVNRTLMGNKGHGKNKCNYYFKIRTPMQSQPTYYLSFMTNLTLKHHTTMMPFSIFLQILASTTKK